MHQVCLTMILINDVISLIKCSFVLSKSWALILSLAWILFLIIIITCCIHLPKFLWTPDNRRQWKQYTAVISLSSFSLKSTVFMRTTRKRVSAVKENFSMIMIFIVADVLFSILSLSLTNDECETVSKL